MVSINFKIMAISKLQGVTNNQISVMLAIPAEVVCITTTDNKKQRMFCGYPLKEIFDEYCSLFDDDSNYEDAVKFFAPNITSFINS